MGLLRGTMLHCQKSEVYCNKSQFHGGLDDVVANSLPLVRRSCTLNVLRFNLARN
jgi:hypothetical protein